MTVHHHALPDRCTPVLTELHRTPEEMVSATQTHYDAMTKSAEWATAKTTLQAPADDWLKAAQDLDAASTDLNNLLKQVEIKRGLLNTLSVTWMTQKGVCLAGVKKYCAGSKDTCKNLGFGVAGRNLRPPATLPTNVHGKRVKTAGVLSVEWTCDGRHHEYQVQYATNPADPSTYSSPATVSKRRFQLAGQTPGAALQVRVMVLDPKLHDGHSDWTAWVPVTVS
jgi:hypothetical protein